MYYLPFLPGANREWSCRVKQSATLQRLRRKTRCTEMLSTAPHSVLDISAVAKPWTEKSQKSLYFLTLSRIMKWDGKK
ncbi:hypothetical protein TNCV_815531 [Trichonephila clavipes]|nr:hypothetical protein TNCV_815531 [Trichonephila clavipes]